MGDNAITAARAAYREAVARRQSAADNYIARRKQRGTRPVTLDRARSEMFTFYWDEISALADLCRLEDEARVLDPTDIGTSAGQVIGAR